VVYLKFGGKKRVSTHFWLHSTLCLVPRLEAKHSPNCVALKEREIHREREREGERERERERKSEKQR